MYRKTLERTKSAAEKIKTHKLTQAALTQTAVQLAALQATAAKTQQTVSKHIDAAVASFEAQRASKEDADVSDDDAAAADFAAEVEAAAVVAAAAAGTAAGGAAAAGDKDKTDVPASSSGGAGIIARGLATESFDDAGEAAEAAAAAAAGDIVDVALFAPGRLLYVKPVDESVAEDKQKFELVDGKGGELFAAVHICMFCQSQQGSMGHTILSCTTWAVCLQ